MNKLLKCKSGYTLVELLVVVGILTVLVAIAIPNVAGIIVRSNVSADNSTAKEYNNAMERFALEYALYKEDILSGALDVNNMDATQSRVHSVIGADSIEEIRLLEDFFGFEGKNINKNTKYPTNRQTAQAIINAYTKSTSSVFDPRQSEMSYWYNQSTGYTVVAPTDVDPTTLEAYLPSAYIADSSTVSLNEWIDLSAEYDVPDLQLTNIMRVNYYGSLLNILNVEYLLPNIKVFGSFDAYSFYIIWGAASKGPVTLYNCDGSRCVGAGVDGSNYKDYVANSTTPYTIFNFGTSEFTEAQKSVPTSFRLCYRFNDNGVPREVYSQEITVIFNELPIYEWDT